MFTGEHTPSASQTPFIYATLTAMKPVSSPYKLAIYFTASAIITILVIPMLYITFADGDNIRNNECVVLLHGLNRSNKSMYLMEKYLIKQGYKTVNYNYDSTNKSIQEIASGDVKAAVSSCKKTKTKKIHFVTHSLGGIVVRRYLQDNSLPKGSRLVMLGPPNKGSELSDYFSDLELFKWLNGDAGVALTTDKKSIPNSLNTISKNLIEIGVIAGDVSFNPFFSYIIGGSDDGKVSVESTRLSEMTDFIVMTTSHTFMMNNPFVMEQVKTFLENGKFKHNENSIEEVTESLETFKSDGCSLFPNGNFMSASKSEQNLWCGCCFRHDMSYWQGGSSDQRLAADNEFKKCILETTGSEELASLMFNGVRGGGSSLYPTWYRWGYGWPYGRGDKELTRLEREAVSGRLLEYYQKDTPYICGE